MMDILMNFNKYIRQAPAKLGKVFSIFTVTSCSFLAVSSHAIEALSDDAMRQVDGQALYSLEYLAPTDASNLATDVNGSKNIGFYHLGLEADLELNANIKKLQLGCGGVNGAGGCDIDINDLSLSGLKVDADGNPLPMTNEERAASSAKITNPFIEFAIKNPDKASTREVVGFRLGAEKLLGLLTAGTENSTKQNGINAISGFMRVQSDNSGYIYGRANTQPAYLDASQNKITGQVQVNVIGPIGLGGLLTLSIETTGGGLNIPAINNVPFIRPGVVVNGSRVTNLPLKATLNVPDIVADVRGVNPPNGEVVYDDNNNVIETPIDWSFGTPQQINITGGDLQALITQCDGVACGLASLLGLSEGETLQNIFLKGGITGIVADATINQGLGYIHNLPINSSGKDSVPSYLSLQEQPIRWPGAYTGANPEATNVDGSANANVPPTITDVAQKGWWLSVGSPINLGSVDPMEQLDISSLFPSLAQQASSQIDKRVDPNAQYISITLDQALNAILGVGDINVSVPDPIVLNQPLPYVLNDLQLRGQSFTPNCYGNLKFC